MVDEHRQSDASEEESTLTGCQMLLLAIQSSPTAYCLLLPFQQKENPVTALKVAQLMHEATAAAIRMRKSNGTQYSAPNSYEWRHGPNRERGREKIEREKAMRKRVRETKHSGLHRGNS